jgi:hypothetical protein
MEIMRHPIGSSGEEPVDEVHLIDNKKTKGQTYQSREQPQFTVEARKAVFGKRKGDSNRRVDQHHSRDGANSKYQEIDDCPGRNADGRKHQQSHGG